MNQTHPKERVSNVKLERYLLGELPPSEMARLSERLGVDPELHARLDALTISDEEIRRTYPCSKVKRVVLARLEESRRTPISRVTRLWLAPAAVVVGAAVWLSLPNSSTRIVALEVPEVRVKGSLPQLVLYRKTDDGSERVRDRSRVRPGDLIRVAYRASGDAYGVILSIDGRGSLTLHWPLDADAAKQLETGGTVLLDFAYELDNAPKWERFYFITGKKPFAIGPVVQTAARLAASPAGESNALALDLPNGLDTTVVSLLKEER